MRRNRILVAGVVLASAAAGAFGGQLIHTSAASASRAHTYTLRLGDKVVIPAIRQACSVEAEATAIDVFCQKTRNPHHQVAIFRDNILVWKVGNPDRPAWHGRP